MIPVLGVSLCAKVNDLMCLKLATLFIHIHFHLMCGVVESERRNLGRFY